MNNPDSNISIFFRRSIIPVLPEGVIADLKAAGVC